MVLKTILVPYYVYGNTSPGGVPYTPNYCDGSHVGHVTGHMLVM